MKYVIRQLLKSPGFTVISLVTLALGIGINTTAFTILNRLLMQDRPFREKDRLVVIYRTEPQDDSLGQSPGDFFDEKRQSTVFEKMAVFYVNSAASLAETGQPAQQGAAMILSSGYLDIIGVSPVLGRAFTEDDDAHQAPLILLSNSYWRRHFGADEKVLGHTMKIDGKFVTVVGVLPATLDDPGIYGAALDVWSLDPTNVNPTVRNLAWYSVAAKLKPGVTVKQAQAEMDTIAARLAHDFPTTNKHRGFRVAPYPADNMGRVGRNITWMIMDLSLVVLLIACANLASLQLVRAIGRSREFAIRIALGSPRRRIVGLLLLESVVVSLCGGALGLLVAKWGNLYCEAFFGMPMPLNYKVLSFAFVISAATGAVFGILPAVMAARSDVNAALKQGTRGATGGRSRHRLGAGLIVIEMAMALVLLTGAGFFIRGIQRIAAGEKGWRHENLVLGFVALSHENYGEMGDPRSTVFANRLRSELLAIPGVDAAAASRGGFSVLDAGYNGTGFQVEGHPVTSKSDMPQASSNIVTPGYFNTCGIRLMEGRDFTESDKAGGQKVAIVSKSLADRFWPGKDPIGMRIGGDDPDKPDWSQVVGVVDSINGMGNVSAPESHYEIYVPFAQNSHRFIGFTFHTTRKAEAYEQTVKKLLTRLDPDVAISFYGTADQIMERSMTGFNFVLRILLEIAILGILLSSVGIYGVVANLVADRTQEIGIRMAIGARAGDILWLTLRSGIIIAALGTVIGLGGSYWLTLLLQKALVFVPGRDPIMLAVVTALLFLVAVFACMLPARRASKVDPAVALRTD